MSPKIHISCGIVSGIVTYIATKSLPCSVACGFSNFMFDIDHCLEYTLYCMGTKEKPMIKSFFSGEYFSKKRTLGVIFHGYEYILLLLLIALTAFFTRVSSFCIWAGILIGYTEHMILDLIGNDCSVKGYSLIYRMLVHFDINKICTRHKKCR